VNHVLALFDNAIQPLSLFSPPLEPLFLSLIASSYPPLRKTSFLPFPFPHQRPDGGAFPANGSLPQPRPFDPSFSSSLFLPLLLLAAWSAGAFLDGQALKGEQAQVRPRCAFFGDAFFDGARFPEIVRR